MWGADEDAKWDAYVQAARAKLVGFTTYTYPLYRPEGVHFLMCSSLDKVVRGEIKRLMIFAPPQIGKSELVSVRLPAFWLGHRPNDPVILTSYGANLAEDKSRQVRDILASPEYQALFPNRALRKDTRAVQLWRLQHPYRGGLVAAGAGGPVTGHGARLGIIDDPFKDWAEAQSARMRDRAYEWYRGTFRTRIWQGGACVLIMTRWHEDDLAARILESEEGPEWTVLRLPALAETQEERDTVAARARQPLGQPDPLGRDPGEPLAPQRYGKETLEDIRLSVGELVWNAEYQGDPRPGKGGRFTREMFQIVDAPPAVAARVRYFDLAGSDSTEAKRTAGVLLAMTPQGQVFVEDAVVGKWRTFERNSVIQQTVELDALRHQGAVITYIEQEPGSSGMDTVAELVRLLAGHAVYADKVTGAKDVRLEPFAAQAAAGNVRLVRGHWNREFLDELVLLPNGKYRDQADAVAGAYNKAVQRKTPATASRTVSRQDFIRRLGA